MLSPLKNDYRKLKWHKLLVSIFFVAISNYSFSQSIKGQIVDDKGAGIPYASVFVKELSLGVASNEDGMFNIKVPEGDYNVLFQSIGYNTTSKQVNVDQSSVEIRISLTTRYYNLAAVKVTSKSEDPAYSIMRKAIALAPYHQNQVKSYNAQVYMKGNVNVMKLSRMVKRMLRKEEDAPKEGEIYIHESYNDLKFKAPSSYEQKVLSTRNTFPGTDNNDAMQFIALNLYNQSYERWISPLAPNAFSHYKFKYLGSSVESDRMIHKIEVIPRRKNQQLLSGTIHIVDNLYCFQSVNLKGEFTGVHFNFNSQFAEFSKNIWMPISHKIDMDIKIMGNTAQVNYVASVSYKDVVPADQTLAVYVDNQKDNKTKPTESETKPKSKKEEKDQKKIEEIMQKEEITTRDMHQLSKLMKEQNQVPDTAKSLEIKRNTQMTLDSMATKRDSTYWENLRPIPLKEEELKSFQKKDSLVRLAGPDSLRKSNDNFSKRSSLAEVAFTGGRYSPKSKKWTYRTDGITPKSFNFNTIDGFTPSYSFTLTKIIAKNSLSINQTYAYAFSRKAFMYNVNISYSYAPMRRARVGLGFGHNSRDFNQLDGIDPMINTIATLAFRENFIRLFNEKWLNVSNTIDLTNGLVLRSSAKLFTRDSLINNTNYSFFYRTVKDFGPNNPNNPLYEQTIKSIGFGGSLNLNLDYTPEYYYRMYGNRKVMVRSRFPTFSFNYNLTNYFSQNNSYSHRIQVGLWQNKNLGLFRDFFYSFSTGAFINSGNIHFADFRHFNTQPAYFSANDKPSLFSNLPFYSFSTNTLWAEFHTNYRSAFLALKFLPFFSNMYWKETIFLSVLSTKENPYYIEVGYGSNDILESLRVSGHIGYLHNGKFYYGFTIGIEGNSIGL